MTDDTPRSTTDAQHADLETLSDPGSLRDRDEVRFETDERTHEDADHCTATSDGRAVVGVTTVDGAALVLTHREESVALLPNATVDPDGDWVATARRAVETVTDLPIDLERPVFVRETDHVVAGHDDPHTSSYTVVFAATLREADPTRPSVEGTCDWDARWLETFPEDCTATPERPAADVRLFLEAE